MENNLDILNISVNNENLIILYISNPKNLLKQINEWILPLRKYHQIISVLVRDKKNYEYLIKNFPMLQVYYANTPMDVESVINLQKNLKIIFYTYNMAKNIHSLRFNHLKHIFIGMKKENRGREWNKSYKAYDEILLEDDFLIQRFKNEVVNTGHLKLKIVNHLFFSKFIEEIKDD